MEKNDKKNTGIDPKLPQRKTPLSETDTEPDEFIAPNADTDIPIDGEIINDAVLRGEPNIDKRLEKETNDETNNDETPPKMNADK